MLLLFFLISPTNWGKQWHPYQNTEDTGSNSVNVKEEQNAKYRLVTMSKLVAIVATTSAIVTLFEGWLEIPLKQTGKSRGPIKDKE